MLMCEHPTSYGSTTVARPHKPLSSKTYDYVPPNGYSPPLVSEDASGQRWEEFKVGVGHVGTAEFELVVTDFQRHLTEPIMDGRPQHGEE